MKKLYSVLTKCMRNFYFLAAGTFLVWVGFVDSNDVFTEVQLERQHSQLHKEKAYYAEKIADITQKENALGSDTQMLERIAREQYLLHKKGEDVFLLVEDSTKALVLTP